jgi:hypothetical protein
MTWKMVMNGEIERILKEMVRANFQVLFQHSLGDGGKP